MRITTDPGAARRPLWVRLAWFVALWAGGVISATLVAAVLRWVLKV